MPRISQPWSVALGSHRPRCPAEKSTSAPRTPACGLQGASEKQIFPEYHPQAFRRKPFGVTRTVQVPIGLTTGDLSDVRNTAHQCNHGPIHPLRSGKGNPLVPRPSHPTAASGSRRYIEYPNRQSPPFRTSMGWWSPVQYVGWVRAGTNAIEW